MIKYVKSLLWGLGILYAFFLHWKIHKLTKKCIFMKTVKSIEYPDPFLSNERPIGARVIQKRLNPKANRLVDRDIQI